MIIQVDTVQCVEPDLFPTNHGESVLSRVLRIDCEFWDEEDLELDKLTPDHEYLHPTKTQTFFSCLEWDKKGRCRMSYMHPTEEKELPEVEIR